LLYSGLDGGAAAVAGLVVPEVELASGKKVILPLVFIFILYNNELVHTIKILYI
jgi:hypothetical protein